MDCTKETEIAGRFEVKGYPTFKYFANGRFVEDYAGQRTKTDLLQFFEQKLSKAEESTKTEL